MQPTDKQKRKIEKLDMLLSHGNVAILKYLYEIEEKIDELETAMEKKNCDMECKIEDVKKEALPSIKDMLEQVKGYTPQKGVDYEDGYTPVKGVDYEDGHDYVLTEIDKKEIASKIKVPVLEKVIEKTQIIKEQPIVKETINNTTIENPVSPEDIKNKLESLTDDNRLDASAIKNLPEKEVRIETRPFMGGRVGLQIYDNGSKVGTKTNEINFESGFLVTESNGRISIVGTGSGGTWYEEILTRTDGTNYTLAHSPTSIVLIFLNGQRLIFGVDYNRTGTAITMITQTLVDDKLTATYS